MSKRMGSVDMSTSAIPWWYRAVLREPGAIVRSLGNRAEEKSLISLIFLKQVEGSQPLSESRDTRIAQTLTQTKAIQSF